MCQNCSLDSALERWYDLRDFIHEEWSLMQGQLEHVGRDTYEYHRLMAQQGMLERVEDKMDELG